MPQPTHSKNPNTAKTQEANEPNVDWSKIPKDTKSVTDIGGPDDPARKEEVRLAGRRIGNDAGAGPDQKDNKQGQYEVLPAEEKLD